MNEYENSVKEHTGNIIQKKPRLHGAQSNRVNEMCVCVCVCSDKHKIRTQIQ